MLSSENEYELTNNPEDVQATIGALCYARSPSDIRIERNDYGHPHIATPLWSMDAATRKTFFIGNGHGDIARFIPVMRTIRETILPMVVVNFDHHVDDKQHRNDADLFSAWQSYLSQRKETDIYSSYNVQPTEIVAQTSPYTRQLSVEAFSALIPRLTVDVMSVDSDILDGYMPDVEQTTIRTSARNIARGILIRDTIKDVIPHARSVMAFVSPMFSTHGYEQNILRELFVKTIHSPVNPASYVQK